MLLTAQVSIVSYDFFLVAWCEYDMGFQALQSKHSVFLNQSTCQDVFGNDSDPSSIFEEELEIATREQGIFGKR